MAGISKITPQDEQEMREGMELYEMTQSAGWRIVEQWFKDRAFHTWVDPRQIEGVQTAQEWQWRELNAFHASNNAKELLEQIARVISRSEYLQKLKSGEIKQRTGMKF